MKEFTLTLDGMKEIVEPEGQRWVRVEDVDFEVERRTQSLERQVRELREDLEAGRASRMRDPLLNLEVFYRDSHGMRWMVPILKVNYGLTRVEVEVAKPGP